MFDVNFAEEFKIITHPSLSQAVDRLRNELAALDFTSHFALFSSGTTSSELKGYILSEKAMEANATAVNEWFSLTSQDVWGLSLPIYHVGGLSVLIRAKLLGNRIVDLRKWQPDHWFKTITEEKVTITTIVPTQLFDLVEKKLKSPPWLRYLIVGGDFLPQALEEKAMELGWPVIRTYGMTEVCSQLASGKKPGDKLTVLPLHEVRTNSVGTLQVKSPSLFTATFTMSDNLSLTFADNLCDADGFYTTQDQVHLSEGTLTPKGRLNQEIKIAGHLTNILNLKDTVAAVLLREGQYGKAEIMISPDSRKGNRLVLMHLGIAEELLELIAKSIRPAIIDEVRKVEHFNKTELGKLKSI
ncbi:MAG: AMP-binding protein [Bdellovibrionota bacterium]